MSKLSIEVDSDTDDCVVKVDGAVVQGIRNFYLSGGYDDRMGKKYAYFDATQETKDPSGLNKRQSLSWSTAGLEPVNVKANMAKLK